MECLRHWDRSPLESVIQAGQTARRGPALLPNHVVHPQEGTATLRTAHDQAGGVAPRTTHGQDVAVISSSVRMARSALAAVPNKSGPEKPPAGPAMARCGSSER